MGRGTRQSSSALFGLRTRAPRGEPGDPRFAPMPYQPPVTPKWPEQLLTIAEDAIDEAELQLLMECIDADPMDTTAPLRIANAPLDDPLRQHAISYLALRASEQHLDSSAETARRQWVSWHMEPPRGYSQHLIRGATNYELDGRPQTLHLIEQPIDKVKKRLSKQRDERATAVCGERLRSCSAAETGAWQSGDYLACPECAPQAWRFEEAAQTPPPSVFDEQMRARAHATATRLLSDWLSSLLAKEEWRYLPAKRRPSFYNHSRQLQRRAEGAVNRAYAEEMVHMLQADCERGWAGLSQAYYAARKRQSSTDLVQEISHWRLPEGVSHPLELLSGDDLVYSSQNIDHPSMRLDSVEEVLDQLWEHVRKAPTNNDLLTAAVVAESAQRRSEQLHADRAADRAIFLEAARRQQRQQQSDLPSGGASALTP